MSFLRTAEQRDDCFHVLYEIEQGTQKRLEPSSPMQRLNGEGEALGRLASPRYRRLMRQGAGEALKAHRERPEAGAARVTMPRLIGVSGLSIYNWEQGKARPRKSSVDAWSAIRRIDKREAAQRLASLEAAEPKSESKQTPAEK